ncbi:MAG: MmgE/PrpD family protein [Chloroflexota bacterium]
MSLDPSEAFDTLIDSVFATETLPANVTARAQLVVQDSLGAICAGLTLAENDAIARAAQNGDESTIVGRPKTTTVEWATLVHGTAGTATELDEGHALARGHPAMHILPLCLALAEKHQCSGAAFLRAFVLGYEVAARVGMAAALRPEVHPHGTWGAVGAAVSAALLLGQDRRTMGDTARIASSLMLAPSFQTALDGASVRNTFAGISGQLGLTAARLAASGFKGLPSGPAETLGRTLGSHFDPSILVQGLGERWEIERGYFKRHACCRFNHAALDALLELRDQEHFEPQEIEHIEVATYAAAARLRNPSPSTPLAARFSIPFALATALVNRHTGPAAFDPAALADSQVQRLAERIRVTEEATFTALGPEQRPARVTVRLRSSRCLSAMVFGSKGDPDQPLTPKELEQKFLALAVPILGSDRAQQVLALVARLIDLPFITELTRCLQARKETRFTSTGRG